MTTAPELLDDNIWQARVVTIMMLDMRHCVSQSMQKARAKMAGSKMLARDLYSHRHQSQAQERERERERQSYTGLPGRYTASLFNAMGSD